LSDVLEWVHVRAAIIPTTRRAARLALQRVVTTTRYSGPVAETSDFPFVYLTADVVAFGLRPEGLSVLVVKRGNPPYKGRWAFPGGFVDEGEDVERAARRELTEETGVAARRLRLEQLGPYTAPKRDPRHRTISVAFLAVLGPDVVPVAGDDAADAAWMPVEELAGSRRLAFDHAQMLHDALERLRTNLERTTQATAFLEDEFTVAELRGVYEAVWGRDLDPGNFQRKVTSVPGFLADTGYQRVGGRGRPATLYTAGEAEELWPPMSRVRDR
jgi:8-oxo-dGTP diphosphatase